MGQGCCSNRKSYDTSFTEAERTILKERYYDLTGHHRAQGSTKFNKNSLNFLFPENPELALQVYNFMLHNSESHNVDYEAFENALEVLIKENKPFQLEAYRRFDKLDMLAILMLGNYNFTKDDLDHTTISYIQAFSYVRNILKTFQYNSSVARPVDEYAIKVVVDAAFRDEDNHPTWYSFIHHIRTNLVCANRYLRSFFAAKFLPIEGELLLPDLSKPSQLLNRDCVSLLCLSNSYMSGAGSMQLLYGAHYSAMSFQGIIRALEQFHGPTYVILKVLPLQEGVREPSEDLFSMVGGFSRAPWHDNGGYGGDSESFVFSMTPFFKNFFAMSKANRDFVYMRGTPGPGAGIGFGGTGHNNFRIWIDGNDFHKSYVRSDDHTYAPGPLVNAPSSYIKILNIELWGLIPGRGHVHEVISTISVPTSVGTSGITYNQAKIAELHDISYQINQAPPQPEQAKKSAYVDVSYHRINQSPPQHHVEQVKKSAYVDHSIRSDHGSYSTGTPGMTYSQIKAFESVHEPQPQHQSGSLDQAISNFESRLSQIMQDRQTREMRNSQITPGSINETSMHQQEGLKKSYVIQPGTHSDLGFSRTGISTEHERKAGLAGHDDMNLPGRRTFTPPPNRGHDFDVGHVDRGRSTYTATDVKNYYNPFK